MLLHLIAHFINAKLNVLLPNVNEESKQGQEGVRCPERAQLGRGGTGVRGPASHPPESGQGTDGARAAETQRPGLACLLCPKSGPSQEVIWLSEAFSGCKNKDTEANLRVQS